MIESEFILFYATIEKYHLATLGCTKWDHWYMYIMNNNNSKKLSSKLAWNQNMIKFGNSFIVYHVQILLLKQIRIYLMRIMHLFINLFSKIWQTMQSTSKTKIIILSYPWRTNFSMVMALYVFIVILNSLVIAFVPWKIQDLSFTARMQKPL